MFVSKEWNVFAMKKSTYRCVKCSFLPKIPNSEVSVTGICPQGPKFKLLSTILARKLEWSYHIFLVTISPKGAKSISSIYWNFCNRSVGLFRIQMDSLNQGLNLLIVPSQILMIIRQANTSINRSANNRVILVRKNLLGKNSDAAEMKVHQVNLSPKNNNRTFNSKF